MNLIKASLCSENRYDSDICVINLGFEFINNSSLSINLLYLVLDKCSSLPIYNPPLFNTHLISSKFSNKTINKLRIYYSNADVVLLTGPP